jgi:hypothetical protein
MALTSSNHPEKGDNNIDILGEKPCVDRVTNPRKPGEEFSDRQKPTK